MYDDYDFMIISSLCVSTQFPSEHLHLDTAAEQSSDRC